MTNKQKIKKKERNIAASLFTCGFYMSLCVYRVHSPYTARTLAEQQRDGYVDCEHRVWGTLETTAACRRGGGSDAVDEVMIWSD